MFQSYLRAFLRFRYYSSYLKPIGIRFKFQISKVINFYFLCVKIDIVCQKHAHFTFCY